VAAVFGSLFGQKNSGALNGCAEMTPRSEKIVTISD